MKKLRWPMQSNIGFQKIIKTKYHTSSNPTLFKYKSKFETIQIKKLLHLKGQSFNWNRNSKFNPKNH